MKVRSFIAAGIATITAACSVQTVGAGGGDFQLVAVFDTVQNLVPGHHVQIADVRVGSVTAIDFADPGKGDYRAKVTMSLEDGRRVPVGTAAQISMTSLLGENYVRLVPPREDDGTGLKSGSTISKTSVQPDVELLTEKAGPLIDAIAGQDLTTIVDAGKTAFEDKGPQLNKMTGQASKITKEYKKSIKDLTSVIDGFAKINGSLADGAEELDRLPSNVNRATKGLTREGTRLKGGVKELTGLAKTINANVHERHAKRLTSLIRRLRPVVAATLRGRNDIKAVTKDLATFIQPPAVTKNESTLLYIWLAGFLSPDGKKKQLPLLEIPKLGDDKNDKNDKNQKQDDNEDGSGDPLTDLFELLPGPQ